MVFMRCLVEFSSNKEIDLLMRSSWAHKMVIKLQQGEKIRVPDTLYQSHVFANHLAEVTLRLIKGEKTGIFHLGGSDSVSRYQFMRTLVEIFGFNPDLLVKGSLKELEEDWEVPQGLTGILPENASLRWKG